MDYQILREVPGRLRLALAGRVPDSDVEPLRVALERSGDVEVAKVYPRIGSVALRYDATDPEARERVLGWVGMLDAAAVDDARTDCAGLGGPRTDQLLMSLAELVGGHYLRRWFLPWPLAAAWTLWSYRHYLREALSYLLKGELKVPVLDAAAIGISLVQGDFRTAASTMFLLQVGDTLQDYTKARSEHELIYSLLALPETAQRIEGDAEVRVSASELQPGDLVVVRTGMPVCVDGVVERGTAMVNQATLTGEPLAVERTVGDSVFAGTAVEDGEAYVRVTKAANSTKLRSIVSLVEGSEELKSATQGRREALADRIVPWNFLLAGVVALATRNITKVSAALMVDYSCALKLTSSISVLSAMSQSAKAGFTVKGSKHFEDLAVADTIVFDKTGTLTAAAPSLAKVLAFAGWERDDVLRFAACLEEHFPHPVARAVVRAAAEEGLKHRERHAEVEYIVAHGVASSLDGKRVVIGSRHFVVGDEHVPVPEDEGALVSEQMEGLSSLYLAVDGELVGVLGIEDPVKPGVRESVEELRRLGFEHIVMLTGDNEESAARVAAEAGITEFQANLLPEDKHAYVERMREEGHHVVMVGDGVNDSPSLSAANVGIAMGNGTAIAREVADVTLTESDISAIAGLRRLSCQLMGRLDSTFTQIIVFNSSLLALGIAGVITPQLSSLLHNGSTVAMSLRNARAYQM